MGRFRVIIRKTAERHIKEFYKAGDRTSLNKIKAIVKDLEEHPYEGVGRPEALKYELIGYWSRRINRKDRMIYSVHENEVIVEIISAKGHYSDK